MSGPTTSGTGGATGSFAHAGLVAIADQFLFVGASSLLVLGLGRVLDAKEYGSFVLAYSTFLLLAQAQTALFAEPLSVFAPSRFRDHAGAYVRAVERFNLVSGFVAALAFAATAGVLALLKHDASAAAFLGAGIAAPALLALWLRRRALYLQGRITRSAVASGVFLVVGVGALVLLYRLARLDALTGMVALGAAALGGLASSRLQPDGQDVAPQGILRAHWDYGRWALLAALLGWSGNLYYFLLPLHHGLASAAALRALLNFVYPVLQANQALTLIALPRWAAHDSREGFARSLARLSALWVLGALLLCVAAALGGPWLVHTVYAGKYDAVAKLLPWVFLLVLPDGLCYLLANALRARRSPRRVALGAAALPLIVLFPGLPLLWKWGAAGAVAAMLIASLTQLAIVWHGWRRPETETDPAAHS